MAAKKVIMMGTAEIARRLQVSRERAYQLVNRRDFPEPYQRLAMGQIWDQAEVEAWITRHRPHLNEPDTEG
jgi:predicted DNA-binding transcriptional regulator AlpA